MDNVVDDPLQSVKPSIHPLFVSFELGVFGEHKLLLIQQLCDFGIRRRSESSTSMVEYGGAWVSGNVDRRRLAGLHK